MVTPSLSNGPPQPCAGVVDSTVWSGSSLSCSLTEGRSFSPGWRVDSATGIGVLPISPTTLTVWVGGSRPPLPSLAISGLGPEGSSWPPSPKYSRSGICQDMLNS